MHSSDECCRSKDIQQIFGQHVNCINVILINRAFASCYIYFGTSLIELYQVKIWFTDFCLSFVRTCRTSKAIESGFFSQIVLQSGRFFSCSFMIRIHCCCQLTFSVVYAFMRSVACDMNTVYGYYLRY